MAAEIKNIHAEPRRRGDENKIYHGGTETTEKNGRRILFAREGAQKVFLRDLPLLRASVVRLPFFCSLSAAHRLRQGYGGQIHRSDPPKLQRGRAHAVPFSQPNSLRYA
jgi:hypothetical protein